MEPCITAGTGIEETGFGYTMSLVSGKYKMIILYWLAEYSVLRYNELKRRLGTISHKTLSLSLKELEAAGQKAEGALEPVLAELASEITEAEPIGEGGVLKAIWNLTGAYETGVRFALRQIPVTQATVEICERFELNPYRLYSSSCALLASENGGRLAEKLKARGIEAAVIGAVRKGIAREMIVQEGQGFLERPQPDELLKAVPDYPVRKEADPEV